jgi:hypothetical protein
MPLPDEPTDALRGDESPIAPGVYADGRYWARTSDLLLVRQALYQLS